MEGIDSSWLECALKNDEQDNEICNIIDFDLESAVPEGQNYASRILRCKINVVLKSGRRTTKRVIIKKTIPGPMGEALSSAFKTETKVYNGIIKFLNYLMEAHEDKSDRLWGKMIHHIPFHTILFEDLCESNFRTAPFKVVGMDFAHSKLLMTSIARFHGMSKILLSKRLVDENEMIPFYIFHKNLPPIRHLFEGGLDLLGQVVSTSWPDEYKHLGPRLRNESSSVCEKFSQMATHPDENKFKVVCHGDLWTCNLLFKYNDYNEPIAVKFIDFQTVHVSSFGWDLAYFLHTSMMPEMRMKYLDDLLEVYQTSLTSTLNYYGYEEYIPSLEDVRKELERLEYYGLVVIGTIFPVTTADSKVMDMTKLDSQSPMNPDALASPKYIQDVAEDLKRFADKGLF